jgi:hypothetical protein
MIETIEDWNARLSGCGCCEMPVCPAPVMVCEGMYVSIYSSGHYDYDTEPSGEFNISLWKIYKTKKNEISYPVSVNDDTTGSGSGGGSKVIISGSFTITSTESVDKAWYKGGCNYWDNTGTITWIGDGSYNRQLWYEYPCLGEWYTRKYEETNGTYTYIGGNANPLPPPDFYDDNFWIAETTATYYTYTCTESGLVVDEEIITENSSSYWQSPFVISTHAAGNFAGGVYTTTNFYEEPVTWEEFKAEMLAWIEENKADGCWESWSCRSERSSYPPTQYNTGGGITAEILRFRFRIPYTHTGSKFTITYDVAEFPQDEDVDPFFVSEDNVVEWTGPGNQEDPEGDSWFTPWVEIDPPEESGERRIVNIRYTCYSGTKYGVKPQVMGEAFEPPAP